MPWKINGTALALASHGDASLSIVSQGADELLVSKSGACDVPSIASGTWCSLTDPADNVVFQGEAILTQGEAEGASEKNLLRILGPWADLERLTWRDGDNLRLNIPDTAESTDPVSLEQAVIDVLTVAMGLGARFTIGAVALDGEIPAAQFDNSPCASVLIALLRWSPGAVVWFTYNTGGLPEINIASAAALETLALPIEGCLGLRVSPRTDFQVPGVRLIYRKKITSTYGESEGTQVDSAGSPLTIGGLIMAIDLNPARAEYSLLRNRLSVAAVAPGSGSWWRALGATSSGDPVSDDSSGDTDLDYYVTAGQLQNWQLEEINGVENTDPHGCTGPLAESPADVPTGSDAFSDTPPDLHIANDQNYKLGKRRFTAVFEDGVTWTIELPVTDLSASGTYYRETLSSWDEGEPVPTGLAAAFYAGASRLAYQGSFSIVGQECDPLVYLPGVALNITSSAWSAMGAPVHAVSHDLATGKTGLEFGPSGYLGAADLLELYRANRAKKAAMPTVDPEEEPAPVNYNAVSASAAQTQEDTETGNLTITITGPGSEDGFDENEAPWVAVGPKTYNGKGPGTVAVAPGGYAVQFLPIQNITSGVWFISESRPEVTIAPGGGETADGSYDAVQRLFIKATGQENPTGLDLNAQDIIDLGLPDASAMLLKCREVDCFIDGDFQKVVMVAGEPYTPE